MSFLDNYSEQDIKRYVADSVNFADVLIKMGRSANSGSNRMMISLYVKEHNIDTSHFSTGDAVHKRTPADIFVEKSTATQNIVRKYYKQGNYSEYKCAICGQEPFWNGQELVLTLDHINGVSNDHRLENLRWICPNCDRQLPTYGAKRKKKHTYCRSCGIEISHRNKTQLCKDCYWEEKRGENTETNFNVHKEQKGNRVVQVKSCPLCGATIGIRATMCLNCYNLKTRRAERPSKMDFAKMVKEIGFEGVGEKYGLHGKSIQKWCKSYGIPHTKKELIAWYDNEMGIVPEEKIQKKTKEEIVRPIKQIDKETGTCLNIFPSQADALRSFGIVNHNNHISQVCRGKRKSAYGYFWQYADEENT